jgi:hypothetical protein
MAVILMAKFPLERKLDQWLTGKNLLLVWSISSIMAAALGLAVLEIPKFYVLTVKGIETNGEIVALQPENHASVIYQYDVGGQEFIGGGHAADMTSNFDQLHLGQSVVAFYNPSDPSVSCLGAPGKHLNSLVRGAIFIAAFPTIAIIVLKLRRASFQRSK